MGVFLEDTSLSIRKLAWACFSFFLGIVINQYFSFTIQAAITALLVAVATFGITRCGLMQKRAIIFIIGLIIGLAWSIAYTSVQTNKIESIDGKTMFVTAVCEDKVRYGDTYAMVDIKITDGAGENFSATLFDFDELLPELKAGETIKATLSFSRADIRYGETYMYDLADGTLMTAYLESDIIVTGDISILDYPRRITNTLEEIIEIIFPEDVSHFMTALLTGVRDDYYDDIELSNNMSHAGLAHVIAVSGMHLSLVVAMVIALGGRRKALFFGTLAILLFITMIGATAPILRAGAMYLILLLSQTIHRESDTITTLFAILAVILLINPLAIHSISLQLSFAAMFGIILLAPRMLNGFMSLFDSKKMNTVLYSVIMSITAVACVSISACIVSTPLVAWHFGYITMYGVITNVLTYAVVAVIFCLGYFACGLYLIVPALGYFLANILAFGARYIFFVCEKIANFPYSVLYVQNFVFVLWLGYVYLIFTMAMTLKGKRATRPVLPICLSAITLCACILLVNYKADTADGTVTVLDIGQGQCIILRDETETLMIDCGSTKTLANAGDVAIAELVSNGVYDIDVLMLTHLHSDHANGVTRLMYQLDIGQIIMPENPNDDDDMLSDILALAEEKGIEVTFINSDKILTLGDIEIEIYAPIGDKDTNESGLLFYCDIEGFTTMITGDVSSSVEKEFIASKNYSQADLLIVGHHGSASSTSLAFVSAINPKLAAISTGYNTYGHPTSVAMENATIFGAKLYRTDLNGTLTFKCIGE